MAGNDDSSFTVQQAQLGLTGGTTSLPSSVGVPTPMPMVRHPGDVARDAGALAQSMAINTMQTSNVVNQSMWGVGNFARQYQMTMGGIAAGQPSPWGAGMAASMMGMGGYMPGMLPSPVQMTAPDMGIYRPGPSGVSPMVPPVPRLPLFPGPFQATPPAPMFSTPYDHSLQYADYRGMQQTAGMLAAPGVIARGAAGMLGAHLGQGLGAALGARFGGGGAMIGATLGAFAGGFGTDRLLGQGIQSAVDFVNPFTIPAQRTRQVQGFTESFVHSGSGLAATGRGLSLGASAHLSRALNDIAGETRGMFSTQDMMRITQHAGSNGLLDVGQSSDAIASQVRGIAKALKTFMQVAQEPDVVAAIRQMGQMRMMGLSLSETMGVMQGARQYARMAGTSVRGIMETGGYSGAMTFQQAGLSAGLGFEVGMGSYGMARQAVAAGTYTPAQLAMLGGVQGVAQRNMESSAAFLRQPLMAAAMSSFGGGGTFGLNANAVGALANGGVNVQQMATMGVNNLMGAVARGGVGALGAFQMNAPELQDQLGRALGPVGLQMMKMQQVMQTQKMMGLSGAGGMFAAARAMGMDEDSARQMVAEANSPGYFNGLRQQVALARQDARAAARQDRLANAPGLLDTLSQSYGAVRSLRAAGRGISTMVGDLTEGVVAGMGQMRDEYAASRDGQTIVRTPRQLLASNMEMRLMSKLTAKDMEEMGLSSVGGSRDTAIFRTPGGRAIGHSELVADLRDDIFGGDAADLRAFREYEGGLGSLLGGGNLETAFRTLTFGGGGLMSGGAANREANKRYGAAATMLNAGLSGGSGGKTAARGRIAKALGSKESAAAFAAAFETELAEIAKAKSNTLGGNTKLTEDDFRAARDKAARRAGVSDPNQISLSDAVAAGAAGAKRLAGAKGEDSFTALENPNKSGLLSAGDDLEAYKDRLAAKVFGGRSYADAAISGIFEAGPGGALVNLLDEAGSRSDRVDAMRALFGTDEDSRVGMLAALEAAAAEGAPGAGEHAERLRKELSLVKGGDAIAARADGDVYKKNRAQLAKAGRVLGAQDYEAATKSFREDGRRALGVLKAAQDMGMTSEARRVGGDMSRDAAYNAQDRSIAATRAEADAKFPHAVETFREASEALREAARQMGRGTILGDATNSEG